MYGNCYWWSDFIVIVRAAVCEVYFLPFQLMALVYKCCLWLENFSSINKAVYRVPDRVGVPCTWPWTHHVHGPCTPVYTIQHAVNGRVHGTYNAVHTGRKDDRVHGTRPCTGRVHGRDRVTDGPCTWPVHGRVHSL